MRSMRRIAGAYALQQGYVHITAAEDIPAKTVYSTGGVAWPTLKKADGQVRFSMVGFALACRTSAWSSSRFIWVSSNGFIWINVG